MKTLVIMLSDQHIPNLLSVEAMKPDRIIYVETGEMKKKGTWSNLKKAHDMNDIKIPVEGFFLNDENSIGQITRMFMQIKERFHDDDIILNLTGGTKLMSIGAYEVFRDSNARLIYKPFRFINEFIDIREDSIIEFRSEISIRQFLRGYGYEISERDEELEKHLKFCSVLFDLSSYIAENHRKSAVSGCLSNLARINNGRDSGDLVISESDGLRTNDNVLKKYLVAKLGMTSMEEEVLHGRLNRKTVRFLTGEWLEIFIWGILNEYGHFFGFKNPVHSITIFKRNEPGVIMNELDVVFLRGTTLCIIECKSGKQESDIEAKNAIYKIKAINDQFKALDVSPFFLTSSDNVLDGEGKIKRHIASRLKEYNIGTILSDDIRKIAMAHRGGKPLIVKDHLSTIFM